VQQHAAIAEAESRRAAEQARLKAEEEIAVAQRPARPEPGRIKAETDAASATAAAAGPLAQADRDQAILAEQEKVAVRQAALTERQLDTRVPPARRDAARYRVEQEAEARRRAAIAEAGARKSASIAAAQATPRRPGSRVRPRRHRRTALADREAIEGARPRLTPRGATHGRGEAAAAEGEAQAARSLPTGQAEAESMDRRAGRLRSYNEPPCCRCSSRSCPRWPAR
jgi:flotillin